MNKRILISMITLIANSNAPIFIHAKRLIAEHTYDRPTDIRRAHVNVMEATNTCVADPDNDFTNAETCLKPGETTKEAHIRQNKELLEKNRIADQAKAKIKLKKLIEEHKQKNLPPLDPKAEAEKDKDWFKKKLIASAAHKDKYSLFTD